MKFQFSEMDEIKSLVVGVRDIQDSPKEAIKHIETSLLALKALIQLLNFKTPTRSTPHCLSPKK